MRRAQAERDDGLRRERDIEREREDKLDSIDKKGPKGPKEEGRGRGGGGGSSLCMWPIRTRRPFIESPERPHQEGDIRRQREQEDNKRRKRQVHPNNAHICTSSR
jgi:hypothetical protein